MSFSNSDNRLAPLLRGYQNRQAANAEIGGATSWQAHPTNTRATIDRATVAGWAAPVAAEITKVIGVRGPVSDGEVQVVRTLLNAARRGGI